MSRSDATSRVVPSVEEARMDFAKTPSDLDMECSPTWLAPVLADHEGEPDPGGSPPPGAETEHPYTLGFV